MCDDKNVTAFEADCSSARGVDHTFDKIVASVNFGNSWKRKEAHLRSCTRVGNNGGTGIRSLGHERRRGILRDTVNPFTWGDARYKKSGGRLMFSKRPPGMVLVVRFG